MSATFLSMCRQKPEQVLVYLKYNKIESKGEHSSHCHQNQPRLDKSRPTLRILIEPTVSAEAVYQFPAESTCARNQYLLLYAEKHL